MTAAATASSAKAMSAGARYYGAITLPLYDLAVLSTVVPYAWQCPLATEQALYNKHVAHSRHHLDVGVATGYFLKHASSWNKHPKPSLTLMDLNPKATQYAAWRLQPTSHFSSIRQITGDAREPFPMHDDTKFDSIGLFHLLHCIPGDLTEKGVVLQNAARVLHEDGVVFGANVTPDDSSSPKNLFAQSVLAVSQALGALNNQRDSHQDMEQILEDTFHDYEIERIGCMSLWSARNPKKERGE